MLRDHPAYDSARELVEVRYKMLDPDLSEGQLLDAVNVTMSAYTYGYPPVENVKNIRERIRSEVGTRSWDFASLSAILGTVKVLNEHFNEDRAAIEAEANAVENARYAVRAFLEVRARMAEGGGYDPDVIYTLSEPGPATFRLRVSDLETLLRATS